MSKTLFLLRHAKSSWSDGAGNDFERGLNNRGRRDAPRMGLALAGMLPPRVIVASAARRAQMTLGGLQDGWPGLADLEHETDAALYTFALADLVDWIRGRDNSEDSLFLIGHNPGLTDLVNFVNGTAVLPNLPTAGFAQLELEIDSWRDFKQGCGTVVKTLFPKEL